MTFVLLLISALVPLTVVAALVHELLLDGFGRSEPPRSHPVDRPELRSL